MQLIIQLLVFKIVTIKTFMVTAIHYANTGAQVFVTEKAFIENQEFNNLQAGMICSEYYIYTLM